MPHHELPVILCSVRCCIFAVLSVLYIELVQFRQMFYNCLVPNIVLTADLCADSDEVAIKTSCM